MTDTFELNIIYKNKTKYYYGLEEKYIDVTLIINNILINKNLFTINNKIFKKDPVPNKVKKLKIIYNEKEYFFNEKIELTINYIFPENVYDKNKIKNLKLDYNKVTLFGKGPTFKNIKKENNEFRCAINQASNIIDDVDLICMNDEHNIDLINDNVYKNLKYLLIPEYQHIKQYFNKNGHWINVYNKLKNKFNGIYIIYNLKTNKNPNKKLINLPSVFTSANNCIDFICLYTTIKQIELYGIGMVSVSNYNELFIGNGNYTINRTNRIKILIENICKNNNIKCIFN
jgi:hypothetical protein